MKLLSYQKALEVLTKALLNEAKYLNKKGSKTLYPCAYFLIKMKSSGKDAYHVVGIYIDSLRRRKGVIISLDDEVHYVTMGGQVSTRRIKGAFWRKDSATWQVTLPS